MKTPLRPAKAPDRSSVTTDQASHVTPMSGRGGARPDFTPSSDPLQRRSAVEPDRPDALPAPLRGSLEALSGLSLGHVKVRYNSPAPAKVGALAYARGHEIHLARGQEQHLPHEAWHIVQQALRRVKATGEVAGQSLNDDHRLEQEADRMGDRAARMARSAPPSAPAAVAEPTPAASAPLQLTKKKKKPPAPAKQASTQSAPSTPALGNPTAPVTPVVPVTVPASVQSPQAQTQGVTAPPSVQPPAPEVDLDDDDAQPSVADQNRTPNEKRWATDPLRVEAQAMAADSPYGTDYTLHHKVSKSKLRGLGRLVEGRTDAKAMNFKAAVNAATHPSARRFTLEHQLINMPMNLELGPSSSKRLDDPGDGFDPNTIEAEGPEQEGDTEDATIALEDKMAKEKAAADADAAKKTGALPPNSPVTTPAATPTSSSSSSSSAKPPPPVKRRLSLRSLALKDLDGLLKPNFTEDDLEKMTAKITAARAAHTQGDKMSPPNNDQWKQYGARYQRRGGVAGSTDLTVNLKAAAFSQHKQSVRDATAENARIEAAAAKRQEDLRNLHANLHGRGLTVAHLPALKATGLTASEHAALAAALNAAKKPPKKRKPTDRALWNADKLETEINRIAPKKVVAPSMEPSSSAGASPSVVTANGQVN